MKKYLYTLVILFWIIVFTSTFAYLFSQSAFKDFLYSITFLSNIKSWLGINEVMVLIIFSLLSLLMLIPSSYVIKDIIEHIKKKKK